MINTGNVGSSFALTTAVDLLTGTAKNDTFTATQGTLTAADTIDGGAGSDTLALNHTGTADFTNVGKFTGIETVDVTNQSASGLTAGTTESANITFQALAATQTVIIAGVTFTAGSSGATAAEVAKAFSDPTTAAGVLTNNVDDQITVAGGILSGFSSDISEVDLAGAVTAMKAVPAGGYSIAAGGSATEVVATSATASSNVSDIQVTGTAVSGQSQVTTVTITEAGNGMDTTTRAKVTINGVAVTAAATSGATTTAFATDMCNLINGYLGFTAATSVVDGSDVATITITTPTTTSFAGFTDAADAAHVTVGNVTNASPLLAAVPPTVVVTDGSAAVAAATYTTTVDASKIGGSTEMAAVKSTGTVTFTNMVGQKAVVEGNGSLTNGATNFTYKATATSTDLEVQNGVTAGAITIDASAATTATVTSTGAANVVGAVDLDKATSVTLDSQSAFTATSIGIDAADKATLTITGAGKASIGTLDVGFDTVTASANTGGVVAAIGAATDTIFTGSGVADTITASTADSIATTEKLAVSGGAGVDTLVIADGSDIDTAADGARYTGFETLSLAASQDVLLFQASPQSLLLVTELKLLA